MALAFSGASLETKGPGEAKQQKQSGEEEDHLRAGKKAI
jgi:hypothetical protein